ncbi:hypothetical protein [Breoghania sp.]|uniref:hypothetical protein n=1 Tax=Breoghania sp. TaxID=2065378 RepID=UPI00262BDDD7|nr:hypothetical protein [Breoghania sp.]MDJ0931724.1 hypothetical protein [Breoghania sp.]
MSEHEDPKLSRRQLQEQVHALIQQVDRSHDFTGNAFKLFQSVAELESNVERRIQRVARVMN